MASDPGLHALLPWYLAGTLDAAEAEVFRAHLARCPSCRTDKGLLEQAAAELDLYEDALLEEHLDPDRLVAGARGELAGADADAFRRHVALCTACALEASWVRGDADVRRFTGLRSSHLGWAAAAAAILALVLLRPWATPSATGLVRARFLPAAERSVSAPRIALGPGDRAARVLVEADVPADGFPLFVEIVDEKGRIIFERSDVARDDLVEGQYLAVDCDRRDCTPGRYEIRIRPARASTPPITLSFEVTN